MDALFMFSAVMAQEEAVVDDDDEDSENCFEPRVVEKGETFFVDNEMTGQKCGGGTLHGHFKVYGYCSKADIKDLEKFWTVCQNSKEVHAHLDTEEKIVFPTNQFFTSHVISQQDGTPCVWTKIDNNFHQLKEDCIDWGVSNNFRKNNFVEVKITLKKGLKRNIDNSTWFVDGTAEVYVNDWEGTLTYNKEGSSPRLEIDWGPTRHARGTLSSEGYLIDGKYRR